MDELSDLSTQELILCVELLLGVSYADGAIEGIEEDAIFQMLGIDEDEAPIEILDAVEDFDEEAFDLEVAAEPLLDCSEDVRLALLRLASNLLELNEKPTDDDILVRLAEALDLEVELIDEIENLEFSPDEP